MPAERTLQAMRRPAHLHRTPCRLRPGQPYRRHNLCAIYADPRRKFFPRENIAPVDIQPLHPQAETSSFLANVLVTERAVTIELIE